VAARLPGWRRSADRTGLQANSLLTWNFTGKIAILQQEAAVPAPVSTASAASIIWSGVGDVKTWPGQAASSMPRPT
jgi:hypothetical protein